jgi:hypothetical protein
VPLREFLPVFTEHVGHVRVLGQLRPKGAQDVDLLRRVRDVVAPADHMCDPVEPVLDRGGEVVGRAPVGADEHDVLELFVRDFDASEHRVVPRRRSLVRHAKPDCALVLVGVARGDEPLRFFAAALHDVELERDGPVPVDAEPLEGALDLVDRLLDLAARVGVLDPQQALAAVVTREQPVEEERADAADMEEAGRARCHPDADVGHGDLS